MPTNEIKVEYQQGQPVRCKVWDNAGVEHDVSTVFDQVRGGVSNSRVWTEVSLRAEHADSLRSTLKFVASEKELRFSVDKAVVDQILEMLPP